MPRRKPTPDTRQRWDDPDLPFYNAKGKPVDAERAQKGFERLMELSDMVDWRNDPTYNLRRTK